MEPEIVKINNLPYGFAREHGILMLPNMDGESSKAHICMRANSSSHALMEARRVLGRPLACEWVEEEQFNQLLSTVYESNAGKHMQLIELMEQDIDLTHLADTLPEQTDLLESANNAPVIRLINALLIEAIKRNASDIHIEPFEKQLNIRFRIDGVRWPVIQLKRSLTPILISRIKVMAKLDIAEKRVPQDGHILLHMGKYDFDIRVSTIPTSGSERLVLRLLDKQATGQSFETLGLSLRDLSVMQEMIQQPHGIILVTGSTGSGKTTTLYAGLRRINDGKRSILTIEDPIEIALEGIGQTEVNSKVDMTFARGLRAILRQDPDVIMVGEIRDIETAQIAMQASLTGHMVLSTLHTNSAVGAITRLHDMGIQPFLISSSLVGLVAQRLVRKLCVHCRLPHIANANELAWLKLHHHEQEEIPTLYSSGGCDHCKHSGYRGRIGVYEVVRIDEHMRQLIHDLKGEQAYEGYARACGPSMYTDAVQKVLKGITSFEEVVRIMQG